MTGVHRDTITRLLVEAGNKCQEVSDKNIKNFHSKFIEVDEIWTFVGKKEKRLNVEEKITGQFGDQYCFVAMDSESKLVSNYEVGKRNTETTLKFISNLKIMVVFNLHQTGLDLTLKQSNCFLGLILILLN